MPGRGFEQPAAYWEIAGFELFLQGNRVGRDDQLPRLIDGVDDSGNEVGERFADAGAGFEEQRSISRASRRRRRAPSVPVAAVLEPQPFLQPAAFGEDFCGECGRVADGRRSGAGVVAKANHVSRESGNQWARSGGRK